MVNLGHGGSFPGPHARSNFPDARSSTFGRRAGGSVERANDIDGVLSQRTTTRARGPSHAQRYMTKGRPAEKNIVAPLIYPSAKSSAANQPRPSAPGAPEKAHPASQRKQDRAGIPAARLGAVGEPGRYPCVRTRQHRGAGRCHGASGQSTVERRRRHADRAGRQGQDTSSTWGTRSGIQSDPPARTR
jgi:hypothetical protein